MKTCQICYLPEMAARSGDNCSDVTGMSGVNDQITDIVTRQPTSVCMYSSLLVQYNMCSTAASDCYYAATWGLCTAHSTI